MNKLLQKKIDKYQHFLLASLFKKKRLTRLSQHSQLGRIIASAFIKVDKNSFSKQEKRGFQNLELYREKLSLSKEVIAFDELGAQRSLLVKEIVQKAAAPTQWAKFYYSLVVNLKVSTILELGTNLGVSGQYLLQAIADQPKASLISLEGIKRMCELAHERFYELDTKANFRVIHGTFDQSLEKIEKENKTFDFVFLDGDHQYDSTIKYVNWIIKQAKPNCVIVLDDIYWSPDMKSAWNTIRKHPDINLSVDLFKLGIVCIGQSKNKPLHTQLFLNF